MGEAAGSLRENPSRNNSKSYTPSFRRWLCLAEYHSSNRAHWISAERSTVFLNENTREAKANVLVSDGETVVIGGIMKDTELNSESGVPYLKDIPVLGWLFKNPRWQKDFEELVVFITPRVLAAGFRKPADGRTALARSAKTDPRNASSRHASQSIACVFEITLG